MRIAVTGKAGQVVSSLVERARGKHEVIALGRPELDLNNLASIASAIVRTSPDFLVSAAAYTGVDQAEHHQEQAFAVNGAGAGEVARIAQWLRVPLIHLSSDYVFDGAKDLPYVEHDSVAPLGTYGLSKLTGECAVRAAYPGAVIVRTAWVYSPFGINFVRTMLHLATMHDEVAVVADQIGNPTSALDIADAIVVMATAMAETPGGYMPGIFHMAGNGDASWADLAEAVFAASAAAGGPSARVRPIATADYPTLAARPPNSRLNCDLLAGAYGVRLPDWRSSVAHVVTRLVKEQGNMT